MKRAVYKPEDGRARVDARPPLDAIGEGTTPACGVVALRVPTWPAAMASLGLVVLAVLGLFWESTNSAVRTWLNDNTYGHGILIAPIVAYLIWRRRDVLAGLTPAPWPMGLGAMAAAALLWLAGAAANVQFVQQFAVVGMIQAAALTILGYKVFRAILFPMFVLTFAVPFGNFLIEPLQHVTATMVIPLV